MICYSSSFFFGRRDCVCFSHRINQYRSCATSCTCYISNKVHGCLSTFLFHHYLINGITQSNFSLEMKSFFCLLFCFFQWFCFSLIVFLASNFVFLLVSRVSSTLFYQFRSISVDFGKKTNVLTHFVPPNRIRVLFSLWLGKIVSGDNIIYMERMIGICGGIKYLVF